MFIKDCIHTLVNNVIIDPMRIQGFATSDATQVEERSYHPTNQFLSLTIEIFGCLHKNANLFLQDCVNAIWKLKQPKGFLLFTLFTFFNQ